ncbi:hypothetical protein [Haloarchaeobius baliensis]|uniref:hypothetical protein n=1 Tax=Haloarchaeobius baliensis TaxID=1670458 RepID=UPI003F881684
MDERRGTGRLAVVGAAALAGLGCAARRLAETRVTDVPLSPLTARGRVGGDWVARAGVGTGEQPVGEMDDMAAFAHDGFDPELVDPAVRTFYERTGEYELSLTAEWHRPFRTGAWLASRLTGRLEQLNLPAPGDGRTVRLESRFERIDPDLDPRDGARMWVRTDADTGDGVFVAAYGSHVADDERLVNIAVPLPGANLSTVLSLRNLDDGALELTTAAPGDPGLYLVTPAGAFEVPMAQRFRVWPADAPGAPADVRRLPETAIVAIHEMWLCGRQFLTVRYAGQTSTSTS